MSLVFLCEYIKMWLSFTVSLTFKSELIVRRSLWPCSSEWHIYWHVVLNSRNAVTQWSFRTLKCRTWLTGRVDGVPHWRLLPGWFLLYSPRTSVSTAEVRKKMGLRGFGFDWQQRRVVYSKWAPAGHLHMASRCEIVQSLPTCFFCQCYAWFSE